MGGRVGAVSGGYPAQDTTQPQAPAAPDSGGYPAPVEGTYTIKAQNLVVIYDVRFVVEPVYGHVGGGEPRVLTPPIMNTCFASVDLPRVQRHFLVSGPGPVLLTHPQRVCYARGEPDGYPGN